jgi:hypothetical protein
MVKYPMIKKLTIAGIILLFGLCAFFGYRSASKMLLKDGSATLAIGSIAETPVPTTNQQNYLFIHVNDLTAEKPALISVWVGFFYHDSQPKLMFTPLFPVYNSDVEESLNNSFRLDSKKRVSSWFISQIQNTYDLKIAGYIISDDTTVHYSNLWLSGADIPVSSSAPITDEEKHAIRLTEQSSWQQFCQLVVNMNANAYFNAINWTILLPDHFYTNLPFETFMLARDQITQAGSPVQCEVLSSEQ